MQIVCTMAIKTIKQKATTKIIIDSRRPLKDNTYPIKIRVTYQRKQVYYSTPHSLSSIDFSNAMSGKKTRGDLKDVGFELQDYESKAAKIIRDLPAFTWELFEKYFLSDRIENNTLDNAFDNYITALEINHQIGTSVSYACAKRSLSKFKANLRFTDVTPDFLRSYEAWMLNSEGNSVTTIGMYLRNLRSLFNTAIENGLIPKDIYPFGKKRYEIPTGTNVKKAIPLSDIALIYNYKTKDKSNAAMAKDYWLFLYLCNGMNMKDMCLLKYKNIKEDVLEFERAKTVKTKRKSEPIRVAMTAGVKRIIATHGNKDTNLNNYIFPVLSKGISAKRERQLIQQITGLVNDHMKVIAETLGIKAKTTTYVARHSFATVMQRSGISTSFISEALGHSNVITTQHYLAGFEDKEKMNAVKALTAFKKVK